MRSKLLKTPNTANIRAFATTVTFLPKLKVLIVGGGGREHALAWKIAQSPQVAEVLVAPGNAGTELEPGVRNIACATDDINGLIALAQQEKVGLTIIGPEGPLAAGIVDRFTAAGLACFGPTQAAAELEASKAFCKDFFQRHNIPTAAYGVFEDADSAIAYIREQGTPIVIKADGLAAGKGVILAQSEDQAITAVRDMLDANRFGAAGHRVVVEEFLHGEEASFIVLADGEQALALASSQDHKAALDGDLGLNTGGMGAYSPAPVVNAETTERVMREVINPTIAGMAAEGRRFAGFLYAGLMITSAGEPKMLEFNVRLGDPETQPIMMRLQSDLVELLQAAMHGRIGEVTAQWDTRAALGVVMAAGGYPQEYATGDIISGLLQGDNDNVKVFHAGTQKATNGIVTTGGRVLCVCALGEDVAQAQEVAYARVAAISWKSMHYRRDIGYRAINRS